MADEICRQFGILRSNLPAFILINRNQQESPQLYPIHDYSDFEELLTPLNVLHSYLEDRDFLLKNYENAKRSVKIVEEERYKRVLQRDSWSIAFKRLERKQAKELSLGQLQKAKERESEIRKFKSKLDNNPLIESIVGDENITYPQQDLKDIKERLINRLNISLNSQIAGEEIGKLIDNKNYFSAVVKIWELVRSKPARLSKILETIRMQIYEHGFDVFISCKSQDYSLAHELYDFLRIKGLKPFLADISIKEVGTDQYTELIGEVINVCDRMIVFATQLDYISTPYVRAEWRAFVNDINSGHKPNAKIINILSSSIDIHALPEWLRYKLCLTIDNYQSDVLHFLA